MSAAPPAATPIVQTVPQNGPGLQRRAPPAPIFAIASGKGGVGKTWLSCTLASIYARLAKRTLLVDGDLGLANVDVQLGVRPQADLAAVMRGWIELPDAVTPVMGGAGKSGGFDLLPGHSGSGALAALPLEDVGKIAAGVSALALHYDRLLLDLAAGVDPQVMRLARLADRCVVVTTEEPPALTDAYAFLKIFRQSRGDGGPTPLVVVNMAEKRTSGRRVYEQLAKACETYLHFRPALAGIVTRDPRVPDSIRAQTLLPVRHPASQAFDDAMRVAEGLMLG
ncbi:MAG: AAA family ATPase [Hyphomonadaceae bacterium]